MVHVVAILVQQRYDTDTGLDTNRILFTGMNKYDYPAIDFKITQLMLFYGGL